MTISSDGVARRWTPVARPGDQRSVSSVPLWWFCPGGEGGISPQRHKEHRAARVQPGARALTEGTHRLTRRDFREPLAYGAMSWGFGSGLRPSRSSSCPATNPESSRLRLGANPSAYQLNCLHPPPNSHRMPPELLARHKIKSLVSICGCSIIRTNRGRG